MVLVVGHEDVPVGRDGHVEGAVELAGAAPIGAERAHERAVLREDLQPVVLLVGDDDLAARRDGDPRRVVELAVAAAVPAELEHEGAVAVEDLHAVVLVFARVRRIRGFRSGG